MNFPNIKTNREGGNKSSLDGGLLQPVNTSTVNPQEYYVHPKLVEDFADFRTMVKNQSDFGKEMGERNYLFSGPKGTGKTLAATMLSAELDIPLFDIGSLVKGQSQATAQVFEELRRIAQSNGKGVLAFIDEVDGLSSRDNVVDPLQYQSLTQMLSQMDGVESNQGIFIIGTTNRPNDLDEAVRSRFGAEIEFLPPDKHGRYQILKIHAHGKGGHKFSVQDQDLTALAGKSYGYVGRDLKQLLNKAFTHAKRKERTEVTMGDLEYGLSKVKPSAIRDMPFVEPKVTFADMVGYQDHLALLKSIVEKTPESVILAYGPKGTGKTMCAEALAGEYGYNFILLKGSELESKWVGESKDRVEKVIKRAKQLAPCVVCFDEISSFIERKGVLSHQGSQTGYLQSVLSRPPEGVYIMATDNNPDFLRGPFMDRFIHKLFFGLPGKEEQVKLWQHYAPEADALKLVETNDHLSCRDIAYACQRVKDYGFAFSTENLVKLISTIPVENSSRYEKVIQEIGNGVSDYRALKMEAEK